MLASLISIWMVLTVIGKFENRFYKNTATYHIGQVWKNEAESNSFLNLNFF